MSLPDTCESRQGRATLELDRRFPVIKEKHTFTLVIIELPFGGYPFTLLEAPTSQVTSYLTAGFCISTSDQR